MTQLFNLFFILCAAIIVPVAIARFSVRADWRTIGFAALIWYGCLFFVTGGGTSEDALGWVFLLAMLLSWVALPFIALVLKGWNWLGQSTVAAPTTAPASRWWQRLRLSILSPAQWSLLALLAGGYFVATYWMEQRDLSARAAILRQLLDLPDGTTFTEFQLLKSNALAPRLAAKARFTEPQLKAFLAQIDAGPHWREGAPKYDGTLVEMIAPDTMKWRDLPLPVHAGDRFVNWTRLSDAEIRNLRRGRALCIALQRMPGRVRSTKTSTVPIYAANDCSGLSKTDRVSVVAVGVLDFDTRTLHVLIN